MTRQGGGWTLGLKHWYQSGLTGTASAVGSVTTAMDRKGSPYKLSDDDIRGVIGADEHFDILFDQEGYNSYYSNGNYEYIVVRGYTGHWTFTSLMAASSTTTTFSSYRLSDDALALQFNLICGTAGGADAGGRGINCYNVASGSPNPGGGSGCNINMGIRNNGGWHHLYMYDSNSNTYAYICAGAQHSSSYDMNMVPPPLAQSDHLDTVPSRPARTSLK